MNRIFFTMGALAVVLAAATAEGDKKEMRKKILGFAKECMDETKITEEQARETKNGAKSNEQKCFIACVFGKMEITDADGKLNAAKAEEIAEKKFKGDKLDKAKSVIKTCESEAVGNDKCETASNLHDCIRKNFAEFVNFCHGKKDKKE